MVCNPICQSGRRSSFDKGQASTSRRLAYAGVNIEFWLPVDTSPTNFIVALGVDNLEAARNAVSEQITDWTYA